METKEAQAGCYSPCGGRHKRKIIIIVVAVVLALAVLAIVACAKKIRSERNFAGTLCTSGLDMRNGKIAARCGSVVPVPPESIDQFVVPFDAVEKGELSIVVGNANNVKQTVSDIAAKNGGSLFSTNISYAPGGAMSGFVVVQVPVGQFDQVFNGLKAAGGRVLRESTEMTPQNNIAYPMSAQAQSAPADTVQSDNQDNQPAAGSASASTPTVIAQPGIYPPFPRTEQNKGYIKVSFVENGGGFAGSRMQANGNGATIDGNDFAQELGRNLLKGSFLILLIAIILWFIRRIKNDAQKVRSKRTSLPAIKKAVAGHAVVKRSKVVRKR